MKRHFYIGRKKCGCCVSVCDDDGSEDGIENTAESVGDFLLNGYTIERVDSGRLSKIYGEPTFMDCPHDDKYCYIGTERECGCVRAAAIDKGNIRTSTIVSDMIRSGLIVERIELADFDGFDECNHGQLELFEG